MSLSSALFSGISGLSTLGNSMTVIGDNIANVNTVGFKSSRVTFQDVLSQTVATTAGSAQVGRGTSLADITSSFSQGSFESTDSTTDLAIGGEGFFIVRDSGSQSEFYTRAGEFRFDKDGNFSNPAGYIVRGWELDATTGEDKGSIKDVILSSFTSSPQKTGELTIITNLDTDATSKSAPLSTSWNGIEANDTYIGLNLYEYQTTLKAYDSLGSTHDITIYYDKGPTNTTYEYIVVAAPDEDKRTGLSVDANGAPTQNGAGMLGRGTLTFNAASGAISDISFDTFNTANTTTAINNSVTTNWTGNSVPTSVGTYSSGTVSHTYTFTAQNSGTVGTTASPLNITWVEDVTGLTGTCDVDSGYTPGTTINIGSFGLGVQFSADTINDNDFFSIAAYGDNDVLNTNAWIQRNEGTSSSTDLSANGYFYVTADFLGGTGTTTNMNIDLDFGSTYNYTSANWVNDSLSTTQYASASTTIFQSADGYGAGDLQSVTVGTDGALTGQYSNGQVLSLYRVALAKFQNNQALFKVGGNLFRETRLSGDPITGKPGSAGLGSISPNSLEQSNVDIATEFVKMITTQRGFQANSKIITVTDQMLAELIALKR